MVCYRPIRAYWSKEKHITTGNHYLVFNPSKASYTDYMTVPCGKCEGCLLDRSFAWSIRCTLESQYHEENYFLTLTYDKENLPEDKQLNRSHVQGFLKRLRKRFIGYKIRVFYCGEYGENRHRPHYHMILFGLPLAREGYRLYKHSCSRKGNVNYVNPSITKIWNKGLVTIGTFSSSSASYVAQYTLKKNKNNFSYSDLSRSECKALGIVRPFIGMSNRPGIAKKFFDDFYNVIFNPVNSGFHVSLGKDSLFLRPLRYFTKQLRIHFPFLYWKFVERPSRLRRLQLFVEQRTFPHVFASRLDKKILNRYIKEERTLRKLEARCDL